ncbi:MAG: GntR family transcriptional regulator [Rhodobacteraceae bacterium]|nr:GntR family transcriptional regulator [Paracoccaceae bacterium]
MKIEAPAQVAPDVKPPAHEMVYQALRARILFGELAPGQPVTIQGLAATMGAGMTPVREAIRRLISDGALVFQGNRRVSVPQLSHADLEQLIFLRKSIESRLTYLAAGIIPPDRVAALAQIDTQLDRAILSGDVAGYLMNNHRFHSGIYGFADAPILAEMADRLWLRFGPSLRVVCGRFGTQSLPDRHKDVLEALRDRDPDAAAAAMEADVVQGMEQIMQVLPDPSE